MVGLFASLQQRGRRKRSARQSQCHLFMAAASQDLLAHVLTFRHYARGIAPPPTLWEEATEPSPRLPPASPQALLEAEASADALLVRRLQERQHELSDLPADIPAQVAIPLAVERILPNVLVQQRALRSDVVSHADRSHLLEEATSSLTLRRARRYAVPCCLAEPTVANGAHVPHCVNDAQRSPSLSLLPARADSVNRVR